MSSYAEYREKQKALHEEWLVKKKERDEKEKANSSEDDEKAQLERDIEKKNEASTMDWMKEKMNVGTLWGSGRKEKTEAEKMVELEKKAKEKGQTAAKS